MERLREIHQGRRRAASYHSAYSSQMEPADLHRHPEIPPAPLLLDLVAYLSSMSPLLLLQGAGDSLLQETPHPSVSPTEGKAWHLAD